MKTVVTKYRTGEIEVVEAPSPKITSEEILVETRRSVISAGTETALLEMGRKGFLGKASDRPDLARQVLDKVINEGLISTARSVLSRLDQPVPLGYSSAGRVIKVGSSVEEIRPGDKVACAGAERASHAQKVAVPKNLCTKLPGTLAENKPDSEAFEAAAFTTLGAIALQGVRVADVQLGERIAVSGLGLIGLLTVQILDANGCRVFGFDPIPERCGLAEELGADGAWADEAGLESAADRASSGNGLDAVFLTAATDSDRPVEFGANVARENGRVIVVGDVGLDVPRSPYYEKELDLRFSRSYGPGRYDRKYEDKGLDYPYGYVRWTEGRNMLAVLELIADGKIRTEPLVSRRISLEDAPDAYEELLQGGTQSLGMVLKYPELEGEAEKELSEVIDLDDEDLDLSPALTAPDRVRVGALGAGTFASSVLLPELAGMSKVDLGTVCTRSGLSAQQATDRFGFRESTSNPDELFSDPALDAILVATRHDTHADYIQKGLRSGKHVFSEKPLCLDRGELIELTKLLNARDGLGGSENRPLLMVGFNRRFAPLTRKLQEHFSDSERPLSVIYRVNAAPLPADHWVYDYEVGGGRIVGEVCHFVDWIQHLVGARPERVMADASRGGVRGRGDEGVSVTVRYADGSTGTVHYMAVEDRGMPKERIEVFGNRISAAVEDFREGRVFGPQGKHRLSRPVFPRQEKGHSEELEAFVQAIRAGGTSPVPELEAVSATEVTFAAEDSLRTGEPVNIDPNWAREAGR